EILPQRPDGRDRRRYQPARLRPAAGLVPIPGGALRQAERRAEPVEALSGPAAASSSWRNVTMSSARMRSDPAAQQADQLDRGPIRRVHVLENEKHCVAGEASPWSTAAATCRTELEAARRCSRGSPSPGAMLSKGASGEGVGRGS